MAIDQVTIGRWALGVNPIYRIFCEEGLKVDKRRARRRAVSLQAPILIEAKPNARSSLDFAHDILTVVDGF